MGMVTFKAWITRRSCGWRGSTRPSCGWNVASASLWSMAPLSRRSLLMSRRRKEIIADLQAAYGIDRHRTVEQDSAFGIRQLVDMALRALSPGINDTTTAVMCVDYLTAILARLASRNIPSSHRYEEGELRVITIGPTFAGLVAESFDQIRGSAAGQCRRDAADARRAANHRQSHDLPEPATRARRDRCNGSPNWPNAPSSPRTTASGLRAAWRMCAKRSVWSGVFRRGISSGLKYPDSPSEVTGRPYALPAPSTASQKHLRP